MEKKIKTKEIEELAKEESERIIIKMDDEMDIMIGNQEGDWSRKLPYKTSYNKHWEDEIKEQLLFFFKLGELKNAK